LRALQRAGYFVERVKGSHHILMHPARPELRVTIAMHRKDLKRGSLASIVSQAGLTTEEFLKLL
jgi:predicted RNA binding protein YcfA (HicA-like mRNA interferase family)